jgi:hypothetical protein
MPVDYGDLACATGVDGDHVDCYLGQNPNAKSIYLVDQHELDRSGTPVGFDEHKVLLGFDSEEEAVKAYCDSFSDGYGFGRIGKITSMTIDEFRMWLAGPTHIIGG